MTRSCSVSIGGARLEVDPKHVSKIQDYLQKTLRRPFKDFAEYEECLRTLPGVLASKSKAAGLIHGSTAFA